MKSPGVTPYRDVVEVPPGCVAAYDRDGLRVERYWSLGRQPHEDDAGTTADTVRALLEDTVSRQMVTDVPLCTLLSGGLDSTVLTALAARVQARAGEPPVRSFAVDFTGSEADFKASEFRPERDSPYALEAARHIGTDHRLIELSADELTRDANRDAVLRAHDLPYTFGDVDTSLHLLFRGVREHSTVALSGESADEVFGGYAWFHDPAVIEAAAFPWHSTSRRATTTHSCTATAWRPRCTWTGGCGSTTSRRSDLFHGIRADISPEATPDEWSIPRFVRDQGLARVSVVGADSEPGRLVRVVER
ncbi:asparagine synthetase B family protein [Streptomyces sp. URMC 128]|uniref:asparagine synthetase B family protein n=1 Tax=Streptomyces sp. URMC 128 TaxID=3423404 RepID=UPI003F1DF004